MYERFTDRARKVMQLANHEARRFNHAYIGTEHILLGLLKEWSSVAVHVLRNRNLDPHVIARAVDASVQSGPDVLTLPRTPRAKKVIEYAMEEARTLNHSYVGTEHILIGLLREEKGVAAQVLVKFGLEIEGVREAIQLVLDRTYDWGRKQHPVLPPMRPIEERIRTVVEPPTVCPKCGRARVVRVLSHWGNPRSQDEEDLLSGKAILGPQHLQGVPPWVCLQCAPAWSEVHSLTKEELEWQRAKEDAIDAMDFEKASQCRDAQYELRERLSSLLEELLRNQ